MSKYKREEVINYPVEEVFKAFIKLNKREFPKFNDNNPLETSKSKVVRKTAKVELTLITKVTAYEENKLYEVTNIINEDVYISRYIFSSLNENTTKLIIEEEQDLVGISSRITILFEKISAKKKLKEKIKNICNGVIQEIELRRNNIAKHTKE